MVKQQTFISVETLNYLAVRDNENILRLVYVLSFFGFGVKAAVFPLFMWLPTASVAPTPVTALLHAVAVVKSGAFAIIRLTYFSYGTYLLKGTWAQYVIMATALITILIGSTMALKTSHIKRRLAYSTISNPFIHTFQCFTYDTGRPLPAVFCTWYITL